MCTARPGDRQRPPGCPHRQKQVIRRYAAPGRPVRGQGFGATDGRIWRDTGHGGRAGRRSDAWPVAVVERVGASQGSRSGQGHRLAAAYLCCRGGKPIRWRGDGRRGSRCPRATPTGSDRRTKPERGRSSPPRRTQPSRRGYPGPGQFRVDQELRRCIAGGRQAHRVAIVGRGADRRPTGTESTGGTGWLRLRNAPASPLLRPAARPLCAALSAVSITAPKSHEAGGN